MTTENASRRPTIADADAETVDEMLEGLNAPDTITGNYLHNGFMGGLIDPFREEPTEDLLAPEILFPEDVSDSG